MVKLGEIRGGKHLLSGVAGIALAMTIISTAYACTVFWGEMTMSGNGTGDVEHTIVGNPGPDGTYPPDAFGNFMEWCDYNSINDESQEFWTVRTNSAAPVIDYVTVNESEDCAYELETGNKLPAGTYTVAIHKNFMTEGGQPSNAHNCHGSSHGDTIEDQSFVVFGNGVGSGGPYGLNSVALGWNSLCVYLVDPDLEGFNPGIAMNFRN